MQASGPTSSSGPRDAIEAEAARLLAKLNSDPTPQEEAEICDWVERDPCHAVAFARAEAAWDAAERLKSAAAVAVLFFIFAAIVTVRTFSGIDRYETRLGEIRDVTLDDGSILHLNSDSEAEVRFTGHGRKVRIVKGEASFEVAPDSDRPFDVEVRSAFIRAVGTAFNVRMRPALVELTVTHGTVTVHSGEDAEQRVSAGNGAVIQPRTIALTRLGDKLVSQRIAWRDQIMELDGETIEQATSEFNRYRKAPILIGDTRVSALRIGGRFRVTDSRAFLFALERKLPVRTVQGEDGSVMLLYRDEEPDPSEAGAAS